MHNKKNLTISKISFDEIQKTPLFHSSVEAGFPSPAEDFVDSSIDLNRELISHKAATFFVRAKGDSMVEANIHSGDVLIVDRSIEPKTSDIILAIINGEFTVKKIQIKNDSVFLLPQNPKYPPIEVEKDWDFSVWGVVTYIIHKAKK